MHPSFFFSRLSLSLCLFSPTDNWIVLDNHFQMELFPLSFLKTWYFHKIIRISIFVSLFLRKIRKVIGHCNRIWFKVFLRIYSLDLFIRFRRNGSFELWTTTKISALKMFHTFVCVSFRIRNRKHFQTNCLHWQLTISVRRATNLFMHSITNKKKTIILIIISAMDISK